MRFPSNNRAKRATLHAFVLCELLIQHLNAPAACVGLYQFVMARSSPTPGERYNVARVLSEAGVRIRQAGDLSIAEKLARVGIGALVDLPVREVTCNLLFNLGMALHKQADFAGAANAYRECAKHEASLGLRANAKTREELREAERAASLPAEDAFNLFCLSGVSARHAGHMSDTLAYHQTASLLATRMKRPDLQVQALVNFSSVFFHQKEWESARQILRDGKANLVGTPSRDMLARLESAQASVESASGNHEDALKGFEAALKLADHADSDVERAAALYLGAARRRAHRAPADGYPAITISVFGFHVVPLDGCEITAQPGEMFFEIARGFSIREIFHELEQ